MVVKIKTRYYTLLFAKWEFNKAHVYSTYFSNLEVKSLSLNLNKLILIKTPQELLLLMFIQSLANPEHF